MKIDEFHKTMDKMFGDRHINMGVIPTPPLHTIALTRFIQTYSQILTMQLSTYSCTKSEMLELLLGRWWINGEAACDQFLRDNTCGTAKEMVADYEDNNLERIWVPKEHKDKPLTEILCFKWAVLTTLSILADSKVYNKTKETDKITSKLMADITKTARNYGK